MKRLHKLATAAVTMSMLATAWASEAETSATAGSSRYQRDGTAAATARYEGDVGFARTQTRSGQVSTARGVSVGVDQNGLSLSVSRAIAPHSGLAVATNFNLSIGRDGSVSGSMGASVANGLIHNSVTAGGRSGTGPLSQGAVSFASGQTDRFGQVRANTRSASFQPRPLPVKRQFRPQPLRSSRTSIFRSGR